MGLFDSIAGQVLGSLGNSADGKHGSMIDAIGGMLNSPQVGGISGLVKSFEQNGLGGTVASWIGTGANLPITPEQLQSVLGNAQVQAIAQKLGLSPQDVSSHLAEYLPQIIDKLTPHGNVPDNNALSSLLGMLKG